MTVDEHGPSDMTGILGAIVRVMPSANATDAQLETLKRDLRQQGVAAVRVMPRAASHALKVEDLGTVALDDAGNAMQTPRELVLAMVDASTSKHKPELRALIESFADAEGV
jgi:hypothetical protein